MRKGFTYLLFGALLLGNSFTHPSMQQSQIDKSNSPRIVHGASAISTAIASKSDPQVEEALVYETETEIESTSTVEEQETVKNEEIVTSAQTEKESAPNTKVDEESTVSKDEVSESEPVVTEEKQLAETESDSTEKTLKEEPQEIEKDTSSSSDDSNEVTEPVEKETSPELSLYEEEKMVLNQVIAQLDFNTEGHQFFLAKMDENVYQVEIRHSNPQGDVEISNMVGLYRYNIETGKLSVMDPITGEFN